MKVLGLIVEYNPFHNGHLYHLEKSKSMSGADVTVCVMSGNFIQRGEPAIVNKWARTKMALLSGVDLVIELPAVYAMASAEFFAYGAVKLLHSLGVVDSLCFGSESGTVDELLSIADILNEEPELYRGLLKEYLDNGLSYPAAREAALAGFLKQSSNDTVNVDGLINSSNNILGIEYIKALKRLQSNIKPLTIRRIENSYNTNHMTGSISSATAIRNGLMKKSLVHEKEGFKIALPETCLHILEDEFRSGRGPVFSKNFDEIILSLLRKMTREELKKLPYVSEGLENRLKDAACNSGSLEEMIEKTGTRRYTRTRIQRILFNILTGVTSADFDSFMKHGGPQYIRILGFNPKGRKLLSLIRKNTLLPLITKAADFKRSGSPLLVRMLEIEAFATDMYVLGYENPAFRKAGQEFTQNIIRISN